MDILSDTNLIISFLITVSVVLLLIASIIIIVIIAGKQRIKQSVQLAETHLAYEKELRTTQQEIQSQLLNQVSSELHDNIGQLLTLMRIQIQTGKIKNPGLNDMFAPVDKTLSETIEQVRALSHSLSSDLLERKGLLETITAEVIRLQQLKHFQLEFLHDDTEPALENDQKLMVFRMFQEMINNILKHAQASKVLITLKGREIFELEIRDDGKGYDVDQMLSSPDGAGLKNIIRRATLARLECRLSSSTGTGSSCIIQNM
jgi:signal transduction histidine kinase